MLTTKRLNKLSILILMLATFGFACSDNGNDSSTVSVKGKVEQNQNKAVSSLQNSVVTLATVKANGSVEAINEVTATTNASGEFNLSFDANTAQNYVIVAENNGSEMMGFISSNIENGQTITLKPINSESSAESKVFAELIAQNSIDNVSKADIETMITSEVEGNINSSSTLAAQFATTLKNSAEARAEFFKNEVENNAEQKLEATFKAYNEAQSRLEADLYAATSAEARTNAYNLFIETTANAMISADVEAEKAAQSAEIWSRIALNSMSNVSNEIKNSVRAQASLIVAIALDATVKAEAESSEMSNESKNSIANAGVVLKSDIEAALGIESEIKAAFENYRDEINSTMENDSSIEAQFVVNVNSELNASNGAKSVFETAISNTTSANAALTIYSTFISDVEATSENNASSSSMSEANIEATTTILLLTNLAS